MNEDQAGSFRSDVSDPRTLGLPPAPQIIDIVFTPEPKDLLPALVTQTLIIPGSKTSEGILISAVAIPWRKILDLLTQDPSGMFQIDPRTWEEIIAGT